MPLSPNEPRPPIAVVGVSALFPGSVDSTGYWADILAGTDRMTDIPPTHWLIDDHFDSDMAAVDKTYGRRGGFLDPVELDVMGFGIPPVAVPSTDTAQLLALIVAQRVLDDATTGQFNELDRSRASVILGVTSGQELLGAMASRMNRPMWLQGMRRAGVAEDVAVAACDQIADLHPEWTEATFPGLLGNVVAGRIANRLDLGGTNCVTDAACASSFSAISMGVNELYLGDSDLVIAGGVDTMNDIFMYMCFSKTPALSPTEDIRPFSDQADGTMLGEGIGMVALKRLADAESDGNHIYCTINGVGASSDGRSKSVYAPVSAGQARAINNAYAKTSYGPDTVELVEAHGTGTVAGDAAEFGGLDLAFGETTRSDRQWCALGSVKSQIGHTKAAAGAAGLIKVIMSLNHKVLPQTAKIETPNPQLELEQSSFYLNTQSRPWVRGSSHERRSSVSSFGFGGSNFHITLAEYTGPGAHAPRMRAPGSELVVLCADSGDEILSQSRHHMEASTLDGYLNWLAHSSQVAYNCTAKCRLAIVATDEADLAAKLATAIELLEANSTESFSTPTHIHFGVGDRSGDVAFVFPGQGSQYLSMGADLAMSYGEAMAAWDTAADLPWVAEPLHEVVFPRPVFDDADRAGHVARLTATEWAQPAIGATSLALLRMLHSVGVSAAHTCGHSFGEITALHAAGVLTETDMLRVARRRGELMADAAKTPGTMLAVARSIDEAQDLVDRSAASVVVANHNTPTQVVLSGTIDEIAKVEAFLRDEGVTSKRLKVATAFHSPVVSGASESFTEYLADINFVTPKIDIYANQTAAPYPADPDEMRSQLGQQLANPVRFVDLIEEMYSNGARIFVEVGPSTTTTGLVAKILGDRDYRTIALDKPNRPGLGAFHSGIGQLVAAGVEMDLGPLWHEYAEPCNPHEIERPVLTMSIGGANYGRPYPPQDLTELAPPNAISPPESLTLEQPDRPLPPNMAPQPDPQAQDSNSEVLQAYEAIQAQTARAHSDFLSSMAQVHASFLETAQRSIAVLGQLGSNTQPGEMAPPGTPAVSEIVQPMTPPVASPRALSDNLSPSVAPTPIDTSPVAPVPQLEVDSQSAPEVLGVVAGVGDVESVLLGVVADKTGYPAEMLAMEMELEGDLGIDSIKRVEILSVMQDVVPGLPEVDTAVMAELVTLGQIVEYMNSQLDGEPVEPPQAADASSSSSSSSSTTTLASPSGDTGNKPEVQLERSVTRAVQTPAAGTPMPGLFAGPVAVTNDFGGVAEIVVELLNNSDVDATLVDGVEVSGYAGAVFLGGLADLTSVDTATAVNRAAFAAARNFAVERPAGGGVFVCVSDLGGSFGCDGVDAVGAWASGPVALVRTAAIEWPDVDVKAIDVERDDQDPHQIAGRIVDELLTGATGLEVGLPANG
ncbi:MAG: acyltransferase domain-containing protein, partial [Actinobacteria bacterium]|nr:acyltransferase domain-containing protein [Actinomycetota bacterium]